VLCNKPIESIVAATPPCPESIAGIALPCVAWREETEQAPRGDGPPVGGDGLPVGGDGPSVLNRWEAYHHSPPVPWRLLLRQPVVRWSLLVLVCLLIHEVMCSLRGW